MRLFLDNIDFSSSSGPNSFGLKLAKSLSFKGHILVDAHEAPDVQLSFIQALGHSGAPIVQRLDGIWFNASQQWQLQNAPIKSTYDEARAVVVQSNFDAKLVRKFFGDHREMHVIGNGTDVGYIQGLDPLSAPSLSGVDKVWSCAASWRPHKRLAENVRYFLEHAGKNDCLVIAGENPDIRVADPRVFWTGKLNYHMLCSLYRASDYFLHLAYLDHCPNTVVDARAAGCHIVCSSSGGTEEIAGLNSTVIEENEWDFEPCELYKPPMLDFSKKRQGRYDTNIDISYIASLYEKVLCNV